MMREHLDGSTRVVCASICIIRATLCVKALMASCIHIRHTLYTFAFGKLHARVYIGHATTNEEKAKECCSNICICIMCR